MPEPGRAPMNNPNEIKIAADGTYTPKGGVSINSGGVAQFDVTYPTGMNTCTITFLPGSIAFSNVPGIKKNGGGTVKVGAGN